MEKFGSGINISYIFHSECIVQDRSPGTDVALDVAPALRSLHDQRGNLVGPRPPPLPPVPLRRQKIPQTAAIPAVGGRRRQNLRRLKNVAKHPFLKKGPARIESPGRSLETDALAGVALRGRLSLPTDAAAFRSAAVQQAAVGGAGLHAGEYCTRIQAGLLIGTAVAAAHWSASDAGRQTIRLIAFGREEAEEW